LNSERTKISFETAENNLKQALELDPKFGQAWSLLARVVGEKSLVGYMTIQEGYAASERYAKRALQVSPNIAEAHAILQSVYAQRDFNWDVADQEGRKALAIDPNDPVALSTTAAFASARGRSAEAERLQEIAIARDPTNPRLIEILAAIYLEQGRIADAERLQRSNLERHPNREWAPSGLARTLLLQGRVEAALEMIAQETNEGAKKSVLPIVLYAAGRTADADAALRDQIEYWANDYAVCIAETYAYRGDRARALEWLERAYRQKDADLYAITSKAYFFVKLADDPRFVAFVRDKLKLPKRTIIAAA
jgi:serine/threonine-protein kinase